MIQVKELSGQGRRLLETDVAIKPGKMNGVLALDMLVVGLSRKRGS